MPCDNPRVRLPRMFARNPAMKPPKVGFHLSSFYLIYAIIPLDELNRKLHMAMLPPNAVVLSLA